MADHSARLGETGFASGENTAAIVSWIGAYASQVELPSPSDMGALIKTSAIMDYRIGRWVKYPDGVSAEILRDPRISMSTFRGPGAS